MVSWTPQQPLAAWALVVVFLPPQQPLAAWESAVVLLPPRQPLAALGLRGGLFASTTTLSRFGTPRWSFFLHNKH